MEFSLADVPNLSGKTFVVTGATSGVGKETAKVLTTKGAFVILACRDLKKAENVVSDITKSESEAKLAIVELDLSRLKSVKACAKEIKSRFHKIDVLINNAAMVKMASRCETEDGFEHIIGVNHFGTYALTIELLNSGVFATVERPRIVVTTSENHLKVTAGILELEHIDLKQEWHALKAYSQSKLCNVLFAYKLHRELQSTSKFKRFAVVATHPGLTLSPAVQQNPEVRKHAMPLDMGVLGNIVSAASPKVRSGTYVGPWKTGGLGEFRIAGLPKVLQSSVQSYDETLQDRLWELSAKRTGSFLKT